MQTSEKVGWVRFVRFFAFIPSNSFESRSAQHGWCLVPFISATTRGNVAASSFQRPPMSIPKTTSRHLWSRNSSWPIYYFFLRASSRALPRYLPPCKRGSRVSVPWDTNVVWTLPICGRPLHWPRSECHRDFVLVFIFHRQIDMWNVNDSRTCSRSSDGRMCGMLLASPLVLIIGAYTARSDGLPAPVNLSKNIQAQKAGNDILMTTPCQQNSRMQFLQLGRVAPLSSLHLWNMFYVIVPLMADKFKETALNFNKRPGLSSLRFRRRTTADPFDERCSATELFDLNESGGNCRERQRCRTQMIAVYSVSWCRWGVLPITYRPP